jgi:hypothetical protein
VTDGRFYFVMADRLPASNPEIWLKQGDPTVYASQPATG